MVKVINGKNVNIPDDEIENMIDMLGISQEEAIKTWMEDEGYEVNKAVEELTAKAKENRITATIHKANKGTREKTKRVRKEDPDKENLISWLADFLKDNVSVENLEITNVGKLIEFSYLDNDYKLDLIKKRTKK